MEDDKARHVVVDSAGFIRNAPLKDMGVNIYTVPDVVNEIRDKATRQRLQVLPYELIFREPSADSIRTVTDFAKKTGDYRSLSAVDIRVMALVYQLEKQHVGTEHLKTQPNTKATWTSTTKQLEKPTDIAGFYLEKTTPASSRTTSVSEVSDTTEVTGQLDLVSITESTEDSAQQEHISTAHKSEVQTTDHQPASIHIEVTDQESSNPGDQNNCIESSSLTNNQITSEQSLTDSSKLGEGDILRSENMGEEDLEEESEEEDEEDDDDGWITPSNIKAVKKSMGEENSEKAVVEVACLTTDFAMQNVLIQMGLNVMSVDGLLIRRAKSYILRCFACMKITTNLEKDFCPHCGNKTLQKVSMIVDDNGSIQYCLSRKKPVTTRGMRYSLPAPRGGQHARNPILCEDQLTPQQRIAKQGKVKYNVLDPDYVAHNSPFAPNDVYSRSAQLGIRSQRKGFQKRRNPNENKKNTGRRK